MGKKCVRLATVAKRRGRCEPQAVEVVELSPEPEVVIAEEPAEKPAKKKKVRKKKAAEE